MLCYAVTALADYKGYDHYGYSKGGYDKYGYDKYGYSKGGMYRFADQAATSSKN
jgi:hypothetical protein